MSEQAVGDVGPWVRWLPLAWAAVADPGADHDFPRRPSVSGTDALRTLDYRVAWWSPLLHLMLFGLGWARPDIGLSRWLQLGRPTDDARLQVISRWWGDSVPDFLAWATADGSAFEELCRTVATFTGTAVPESWRAAPLPAPRPSADWELAWGGGSDSLHLGTHVLTPLEPFVANEALLHFRADSRRAVLMLDRYAGWYRALSEAGPTLPRRADGRSWSVDVVVRSLGWLGSYRRSRQTGRWFAGKHRWHELGSGNDE